MKTSALAVAVGLSLLCSVSAAHADEVAPSEPSEAVPSPTPVPRARVHIKAPQPSYLYRRVAGTTDFVIACQTPCDAEMPIGESYKIGGRGFKTTAEFTLDAAPGASVDYTVDGPSWAGIVGGGALVLGGALSAYIGATFALSSCDNNELGLGCKEKHNAGGGALAIGSLGVLLGLAIVYPSLKTDLAPQKDRPSKDAFLRTPTWRSVSPATEGTGVTATFPLVYEGRF